MMYRPVVAADKDAIEVHERADPNGRQSLIIPSRWTEIRRRSPSAFGQLRSILHARSCFVDWETCRFNARQRGR